MRRIFLNADDFGLTNGVTRGIARAMLEGIVTTTSAMPCVPGSPERVSAALGPVNGRVGAHLQLTDGVPCCDPREIPSLVNGEGRFPRSWKDLAADRLNPDEIRKEWTAQIDRVLDWGIRPSHLDTHHHVHRFEPPFRVYCELALSYGLPVRTLAPQHTSAIRKRGLRCADVCCTAWWKRDLTPEGLVEAVEKAFTVSGSEGGFMELMTHPGYADGELQRLSLYVEERERELLTLCDPDTRKLLESRGFILARNRSDCERGPSVRAGALEK